MKRFIVAMALLLVMVLGCWSGYRYIHETSHALAKQVESIDSTVESGNFEEASRQLAEAYAGWQEKHNVFCMIVRHTELDEIEFLFLRARQHIANQDSHSYLVQSHELQGYLLHLPEMELPTLSNIF